MIRPCTEQDVETIYAIVNDAAMAYKGVIPADRWHEPYMPRSELQAAIASGVQFWGYEMEGALVGVMGVQPVQDITLIRHAYVLTSRRRHGIGGQLLDFLLARTGTPVLIGTWAAADWAIRFYQKHGFALVPPEEKDRLLPKYWGVPQRQIETSVVLGDQRWFGVARAGADGTAHRVCPYWMGYVLLCPLRRFVQNPAKILAPYVTRSMAVLEVGPGMGFFTLPMAEMVGPTGKVVSVDAQTQMLSAIGRRAASAGLVNRIDARRCKPDTLGIADLAGTVDFVLLFAVAHEVPHVGRLFGEIAQAMRPGARCLLAEPRFHVSAQNFEQTMAAARLHGLLMVDQPRIWGSHTAVLTKPEH